MAIKRPDQLSGVSSIGENDILIAEINPDDPLNRKVVKISKSDFLQGVSTSTDSSDSSSDSSAPVDHTHSFGEISGYVPLLYDSGLPNYSAEASSATILGTNYIDVDTNILYEMTTSGAGTNQWSAVGELGQSRFSGETGFYLTVTGHTGYFRNSAIIGTGCDISLIVTHSGYVGINTENPATYLHVSGDVTISGGQLFLDYNSIPSSDPIFSGAVYRDMQGFLKISSGIA